jgi:ribosomal-protein-alanine N-acetyltransferase
MKLGFSPFPFLTTERLALRKLEVTDRNEIFLIRSDLEINKFIERPRLTLLSEAEEFIRNIHRGIEEERCLYWAINRLGNPKLIGTICLWNFSNDYSQAELGYELIPAHQGQGFLQESMRAVIPYGFVNLSLNRMEAYTHKDNLRSIQLLVKNGFTQETDKLDVDHTSNIIFSIHQQDFQNTKGG